MRRIDSKKTQVCYSVVSGYHKLTLQAYKQLAALQLVGTISSPGPDGKFDFANDTAMSRPGVVASIIPNMLPQDILKQNDVKELEEGIMQEVAKLHGYTRRQAKLKYIDILQYRVTFGATFFELKRVETTKKGHLEEHPQTIAISERGLLLLNPVTNEIEQGFTVSELLTFGIKGIKVLFVVGTAMKHKKLTFHTNEVSSTEYCV
jgi:hypothetical protein